MLDQLLWYVYLLLLIVAVGPNVTYAFWIQRATADQEALPFTLNGIKVINDRIVLPATGLALIAWIVMVSVSGQSLFTPWILVTAIFWLAAFLIGILGYSPTLRKQIDFAERAGTNDDEYKSAAWRAMILGIVIGIIFLLILLLMAFQPALWS